MEYPAYLQLHFTTVDISYCLKVYWLNDTFFIALERILKA